MSTVIGGHDLTIAIVCHGPGHDSFFLVVTVLWAILSLLPAGSPCRLQFFLEKFSETIKKNEMNNNEIILKILG